MADACGNGDTGGSWYRLVCNSTVQGGNCCGEMQTTVMMVYNARTACTGACRCGTGLLRLLLLAQRPWRGRIARARFTVVVHPRRRLPL